MNAAESHSFLTCKAGRRCFICVHTGCRKPFHCSVRMCCCYFPCNCRYRCVSLGGWLVEYLCFYTESAAESDPAFWAGATSIKTLSVREGVIWTPTTSPTAARLRTRIYRTTRVSLGGVTGWTRRVYRRTQIESCVAFYCCCWKKYYDRRKCAACSDTHAFAYARVKKNTRTHTTRSEEDGEGLLDRNIYKHISNNTVIIGSELNWHYFKQNNKIYGADICKHEGMALSALSV